MPSLGRSGEAAAVFANTYKAMLLQPGVYARQHNQRLNTGLPQGLRGTTIPGFGPRGVRVPRGATSIHDAFRSRFGDRRFNKFVGQLRKTAADDLKNRIFAQIMARRGIGGVLTSSGSRRRPLRLPGQSNTPAPTLGQQTSLGG